ncbi:MAG TPA: NAD-dependent epimerase/dehydratase family protein, partial [Acidobacteria bacterium]|nr:NAD-dependent epimerase/dehydratase family protein [Acidobacteriota bacterium]
AGSAVAFERGNREGTARVVQAVAEAAPEVRLVHVSSQAALGPSPAIDGLGPDAEPHPISAYGRSKLGAEKEVRARDGLDWVIVRPPAIYGPRDIDVLQFFKLAARGVVPLPRGERWVTMAWVGDVVRGVLAAAHRRVKRGIYHLGEPYPYRMKALVQLLARAGGLRARVVPVPETVLAVAGTAGSGLQRLGFRQVAMTRDKARELTARHWTLRTHDSLAALGIDRWMEFPRGAALTWEWYRNEGWLR